LRRKKEGRTGGRRKKKRRVPLEFNPASATVNKTFPAVKLAHNPTCL